MLYTVSSGSTINAQDVNQLVNRLQQGSGGQELGKYVLAGAVYANGATVSYYYASQSRIATPVSVSIDTADLAPSGGMSGTPSTALLTASGVQIFSTSTTLGGNNRAGGNITIQY